MYLDAACAKARSHRELGIATGLDNYKIARFEPCLAGGDVHQLGAFLDRLVENRQYGELGPGPAKPCKQGIYAFVRNRMGNGRTGAVTSTRQPAAMSISATP